MPIKNLKNYLIGSVSIAGFFLSTLTTSLAETNHQLEDTQRDTRLSAMERVAQKNLGRDVAFKFHPYLFGLTGVRLDNFKISESESYFEEHRYLDPWAVRAESVDVRYNPFAILIGRISVKKFEMIRPQVQFSIDGLSRTNFDDLVERQKTNRFSNWFRTHHMSIQDMQLDIFSELLSAQPIRYQVEDINVDIRNLVKKKVAPINITAKTPGSATTNVDITGSIGPIVSIAKIEDSPMNIQFRVKDAPLDFELAKLPDELMKDKVYRRTLALPESGLGNIAFDFIGDSLNGLITTGEVALSDIVLASIDKQLRGIPFDVNMDIKTHLSLNSQITELEQFYIDVNGARITIDGKVTNIVDNPTANLTLDSTGLDLVKFHQIYPFIAVANEIKPVGGNAFLDFDIGGDRDSGYTVTGQVGLKSVKLASLDGKYKGQEIDAVIDLKEGIHYYNHQNEVVFNGIDLNIANTRFNISGNVANASQIERELTATIKSDAVDIKAVHDFFPFYDEYLPPNVEYGGNFSFSAQAKGTIDQGTITGKADLSELTFILPNFVNKQKQTPFDVDFSAKVNHLGEIEAGLTFQMEEGTLDQASIYLAAIRHLLGGERISAEAKRYLSTLDKETFKFAKSSGSVSSVDLETANVELNIQDLQAGNQRNVDMFLKGTVDISDFSLDLSGELIFPHDSFLSILAINDEAAQYVVTSSQGDRKYLKLPILVKGSVIDPKFEPSQLMARYSN